MAAAWRRAGPCCVICVALLSQLPSIGFALEFSPLTLVNRASDYVSETYSTLQGLGASYVFFGNEPIRFDIIVFNNSGEALELRSNVATIQDAFVFSARTDGAPFASQVSVTPAVYMEGVGPRWPIDFGPRLVVQPRQQIVFHCEIADSDLLPGRYRVEITSQMADEHGRRIAPQGSILDIEVRSLSTPQAIADSALRRGYRAYLTEQYDAAEQVADELLRSNPQSYGALVLKGKSLAKKNPAEALRLYRAALVVVENNADSWCTRCIDPRSRSQVVEGLRCLISGYVCE